LKFHTTILTKSMTFRIQKTDCVIKISHSYPPMSASGFPKQRSQSFTTPHHATACGMMIGISHSTNISTSMACRSTRTLALFPSIEGWIGAVCAARSRLQDEAEEKAEYGTDVVENGHDSWLCELQALLNSKFPRGPFS
jgi:hypothetical protein